MKKKLVAVPVALCVLSAMTLWARSNDDSLPAMTLKRESGRVHVLRGEESIDVTDTLRLVPNDIITTRNGSAASLRLEGDRHLLLAEDSQIGVLNGTVVRSEQGSLLVKAEEDLEVRIADAVANAEKAAFRIDRAYGSTRAGVYRGSIALRSPGIETLEVEPLFQASMTAGHISHPGPYVLRRNDAWDNLMLPAILDLDEQLSSLRRALYTQLGTQEPKLGYFEALAPGKAQFMRRYISLQKAAGPSFTADLLIAFTIASNASHSPASQRQVFASAYDLFFEQGASWGVVAGIVGIRPASFDVLVADLEDTILRTGAFAARAVGKAEFTLAADTGGEGEAADRDSPPSDVSRAEGVEGIASGGDDPTGGAAADAGSGSNAAAGDGDGDAGGDDSGGKDDGKQPPGEQCRVVAQCTIERIVPEPTPPGRPPGRMPPRPSRGRAPLP